jgi:hypothetical protein
MDTYESVRRCIVPTTRRLRLGSHHHHRELSDQSGNRADCREHRSKHCAHDCHRDGNLYECVSVFILDDDSTHVAFVDEGFHLIDEIPSEYLYFFYKVV